jgi:membrane-bound lytic murein transglycosylase A
VTSPVRLTLIVLVSMLVGAGLGAGLIKRLQPPPAPVPIAPPAPVAKSEQIATYREVSFSDLPGWSQDTVAQALPGIKRSCARLAAQAPQTVIGRDAIVRSAGDWQTACNTLGQISDGDAALRAALESLFSVYHVGEVKADPTTPEYRGTFTSYYEADLNGALSPGGKYQVPVYGVPRSLVTVNLKDFLPPSAPLPSGVPANLVGRLEPSARAGQSSQIKPFFTRAEIDSENAIAQDADILFWAEDPVAVHILHIQGSGRVTLPDGQIMRVGFAGHNGRSFKGIGSILLEAGEVKPGGASMVAVREWLQRHPVEAVDYMNRNTRYIFFRRLDPSETEDGPVGAQGVSLTPGRSLAVDPRYIPLGAPIWLDTKDPDGLPIQRLMIAQDVGAAITGPVRGDVFWGAGEEAFLKAGRMKSAGEYFVFIPKSATPPPPG